MRTVLVTGASTGFGRLTVEALARHGHQVFAGLRDIGAEAQPQTHRDDAVVSCKLGARRHVAQARRTRVRARDNELDLQIFHARQNFFVAELRGAAGFGEGFHAQRRPSGTLHRIAGDVIAAHFEVPHHMVGIDRPWRSPVGEQQQWSRGSERLRIHLQAAGARGDDVLRCMAQSQRVTAATRSAGNGGGRAVARVAAECERIVCTLH